MFYEKASRSIIKAVVFRLLIICSDAVIIYLITHRYDLALGITVFSNIASTTIYFINERVWNGITWGKQKAI